MVESQAKNERTEKLGVEALKNNIYSIAAVEKQADQYTKTTKAIGDYAGRVYGHNMKLLVTTGTDNVPTEPEYRDRS